MNKNIKKLAAGMGICLVISSVVVTAAQEEGENPSAQDMFTTCMKEVRSNHQAELAEALGMTVEELEEAIEEGASLRQLAEEAGIELPLPPRGKRGLRRPTGGDGFFDGLRGQRNECLEEVRQAYQAELAEALGMTIEELEEAIEEGASLRQLAEEAGIELPLPPRGKRGLRRPTGGDGFFDGPRGQHPGQHRHEGRGFGFGRPDRPDTDENTNNTAPQGSPNSA